MKKKLLQMTALLFPGLSMMANTEAYISKEIQNEAVSKEVTLTIGETTTTYSVGRAYSITTSQAPNTAYDYTLFTLPYAELTAFLGTEVNAANAKSMIFYPTTTAGAYARNNDNWFTSTGCVSSWSSNSRFFIQEQPTSDADNFIFWVGQHGASGKTSSVGDFYASTFYMVSGTAAIEFNLTLNISKVVKQINDDANASTWTSSSATATANGGDYILLNGMRMTLGSVTDLSTTWTWNSGNSGILPSQMPSTDGTASTLITSFSATSPFGTLPTHGNFFVIEPTEDGTVTINCKPSTDASQKLVFVTMDSENLDQISEVTVNASIWNASYSFEVEAGRTYYFFQLAYPNKLTSYRFTLKGVSFERADQKKIKVFTIGDSTMANKSSSTERGWGMLFPQFVDADQVAVNNYAVDGRSTLSFINEGRWTTVLEQLSEGDYVLIQFGHNDEKTDASLHTDPQTTYKQNLTKFVNETRAKGANPVLLTPIVRRIFGSDGNIYDEHTEYAEAVRELASSLNVPLIDMNLLSSQYENIAGIVGSRLLHEYFPGTEIDNTHLCQLGAYITARCVAEQIAADEDIAIALNENPAALDGAYSSTLEYAQQAFSGAYPAENVPETLDDIDEAVRSLRSQARMNLSTEEKPADATFALVNPDFSEGFCWYNAVQATRPMAWTIDYSGSANLKSSTAAKGTLIEAGQEHLQLWGINAIGNITQTVTGLADGRYEVGVTYYKSGTLSCTLFANNQTTDLYDSGLYTVVAEVNDGTLSLGITFSSTAGASLDIDNFTLRCIKDVIVLDENATEAWNMEEQVDVTLNRTLKGGVWQGFSLPFPLTAEEMAESPLAGAELVALENATGTTLNFKPVTDIEAGMPYFIRPAEDIVNPSFDNVSITVTEPVSVEAGDYTFVAQLWHDNLPTDGSVAYLSTETSSLKRLTSGGILGMRAYLLIPTESDVKLNFGETATAVEMVSPDRLSSENCIYTLGGVQVEKAGMRHGVYIVNGKKVLVK